MSGIFVKLYVDAVRSGMIADMGAEKLQTLLVLASYMDAHGRCYPTQWAIAEALGVARETANRRVAALLRYRWRGSPIVTAERRRDPTVQTWANTVYTILPESHMRIFDTS
ncbi:helix-turn-helix domain-containing protein [Paenibacillus sp. BIHB 4019]|uniref:helix-turn-helix domain-containing protein n=1 Tax=Paenibacillus sp. BIHB 4019 TaxID=1870819 RepID=UPI000C158797|nr:helix-turn-helix domain-containing protein [Paenibacillus sp. BIHB 4019]